MAEEVENREEQEEIVSEEVTEETGEETQEVPFWMQEEEPDSSGGEVGEDEGEDGEQEKSGDVPVSTHIKVKQKLKGRLKEQDSELEKLRKELEELKSKGSSNQSDLEPPKRPRRADFDDDDDYETALDEYESKRDQYLTQHVSQNSQKSQAVQKRQQQIDKAVDDHYTRAENVVKKYGIKPEIYQQSDAKVKEIIQEALPKLDAEAVFNGMVEMVGEGSEVTMFHIGRNKQAAAEFSRLLHQDPTGLKAALYLGRVTEKVSNSKPNRTSQAPAPSAKARGDESSTLNGGAAHKKWQEAHKKGDAQKAYKIKQEARKQGIDVKAWK